MHYVCLISLTSDGATNFVHGWARDSVAVEASLYALHRTARGVWWHALSEKL